MINRETTEGGTQIANAHGVMVTSVRAAADHMRAFTAGVQSGRTVSNWTLARAAVETLGRAHYLASAASPEALLSRHVALINAEFKYSSLHEYVLRNGTRLDPDQYLRDMAAMLDEVGVESSRPPTPTGLAVAIIDAAAPGNDGRRRYSQLSSAAHGEAIGVQMFSPDVGAPLALPGALVRDTSHMQVACCLHVGDGLLRHFEPAQAIRDRWNGWRDRALAAGFAVTG